MEKIHRSLVEKNGLYAKWHRVPHYHFYHFAILIVVGVFFTGGVVKNINAEITDVQTDAPSEKGAIQKLEHTPIKGSYIVQLKGNAKAQDVLKEHGLSAKLTYSHALNGFAAEIPDGRLEALKKDPRVETVEEDAVVTAFAQTTPTSVKRIGTLNSNTAKIDGLDERVDVDIALLDSGIDLSHPDLSVFNHISFVSGDTSAGNDGLGHGTFVAGVVAALDNDFGVVGVAPGARLWSVRVLDNLGVGSLSALISGVDYVTSNATQIEVANISGGFVGTSTSLRTAIQNSIAKGVVYVVSAGNSSKNVYGADGVFNTADDITPASFSEVITVSSMNDNDGISGGLGGANWDDALSFYSNFGQEVDLAGVGTPSSSTTLVSKGSYSNQYTGTSLAAAHVSGSAALYIAKHGRATSVSGVAAIRQALVTAAETQSVWGPADTLDPDTFHEGLVSTDDSRYQNMNALPVVSITSPANNSNLTPGLSTSFSGSASDTEDGDLSSQMIWTSNLSGQIGTGPSFLASLTAGLHTITASTKDSANQVGSFSISLNVTSPVSGSAIEVSTASLDFGNVKAGATATKTLQITNTGGGVLSVGSIVSSTKEFKVSSNSLTIQPGATSNVVVTFAPGKGKSPYKINGLLQINHNGDNTSSPVFVTLSGTRIK